MALAEIDHEPRRGRPRDAQRTAAILSAAYELLVEHGMDGFRATEIAKRAGVSTATLYRRWSSKEAIVMEAYLAVVERRIRAARPSRGRSLAPLERLRAQLASSATAMAGAEGRVMTSLVRCAQQSGAAQAEFLDRLIRPRRELDRQLVMECVADGSIARSVDPDLLLDALYGPLYFRLFIGLGKITRKDILRHFELVLGGARG